MYNYSKFLSQEKAWEMTAEECAEYLAKVVPPGEDPAENFRHEYKSVKHMTRAELLSWIEEGRRKAAISEKFMEAGSRYIRSVCAQADELENSAANIVHSVTGELSTSISPDSAIGDSAFD